MVKIITKEHYDPTEWSARESRDDETPIGPVGWGPTEEAAIKDLKRLQTEQAQWLDWEEDEQDV